MNLIPSSNIYFPVTFSCVYFKCGDDKTIKQWSSDSQSTNTQEDEPINTILGKVRHLLYYKNKQINKYTVNSYTGRKLTIMLRCCIFSCLSGIILDVLS